MKYLSSAKNFLYRHSLHGPFRVLLHLSFISLAVGFSSCSLITPDYSFTNSNWHAYSADILPQDERAVRSILDTNGLSNIAVTDVAIIKSDGRVHSLHLGNLGIAVLPEVIGDLTVLTSLYLDSNQLIQLPPAISKLKLLQLLAVSYNLLISLPDSIVTMSIMIEGPQCMGPCGGPDCCYSVYSNGLNVQHNSLCLISDSISFWLDKHDASWASTQVCR